MKSNERLERITLRNESREAYLKRCGSPGYRAIPALVRKMQALREELLAFPEGEVADFLSEAFQALSFTLMTVASLADGIALPTPERAERRFRRFDAQKGK